jgi:hypothetical protein
MFYGIPVRKKLQKNYVFNKYSYNLHGFFTLRPYDDTENKLKGGVFRLGNYLRGEIFMKKSILMAIIALALLAAPVFAGDYSITANCDVGWGWALSGEDLTTDGTTATDGNKFTNDFTLLQFAGAVDDNNTLVVQLEYGTSGSGENINAFDSTLGLRGLRVMVTEFSLSTNILGSFGLTDLPVTLTMTNGFGRANLHNRFQQWTGWEIKRWKDAGCANFVGDWGGGGFDPAAWERTGYINLTVGIVNMVNVAFAIVPLFGTKNDADEAIVPIMVEAWTSGLAFGPVSLDICANLRSDGHSQVAQGPKTTRFGLQATANMSFGAFGLMVFLGDDIDMQKDIDGINNHLAFAVKPSFSFGIGSVALGAWMTMETNTGDRGDTTQMDMAIDLSATFSKTTIYGGILIRDLNDSQEDNNSPMKLDVGISQGFGSASLSLGVTAVVADDAVSAINNYSMNSWDIGAADGSGNNLLDGTDATATLYLRAKVWY